VINSEEEITQKIEQDVTEIVQKSTSIATESATF
jgi:hypothetical protein